MTHQFPLRRREFIKRVAAITAPSLGLLSLGACTQQPHGLQTIGFLSSASPDAMRPFSTAFHSGLSEEGFEEGRNVAIEYRWAGGQYDRLPALAADLVDRRVALIAATGGIVSARAAQASTSTIPVLFISGFDPVRIGLVKSLNQPGQNATGVSVYSTELMTKRLELLHELVPAMTTAALLLNPDDVLVGSIEKEDLDAAAKAAGMRMVIVQARAVDELRDAFSSAADQRAEAVLVSASAFFTSERVRLVALAKDYAIPTAYPWGEYVEAGGLMSYGPDIKDSYRQIGQYAGRILKGTPPSRLPVQLPTKFKLGINRKTADGLGLAVPHLLLASAEQIIE